MGVLTAASRSGGRSSDGSSSTSGQGASRSEPPRFSSMRLRVQAGAGEDKIFSAILSDVPFFLARSERKKKGRTSEQRGLCDEDARFQRLVLLEDARRFKTGHST